MQEYMLIRVLVISVMLVCTALICTAAKAAHKVWTRLAHKGGEGR